VHNPITAYYYLLLKKKVIQGEPLDDIEEVEVCHGLLMPQDRQTKRYQSIEPVRTTLYNEKNKSQLRKIAEGLNNVNLARVSVNATDGQARPFVVSPKSGSETPAGQNAAIQN